MQERRKSLSPAIMLAMMMGGLVSGRRRSYDPEKTEHSAKPAYIEYKKPIESKRKQRKRLGKKGKKK